MTPETKAFMNKSRAALRQLLGVQPALSEDVVRAYAYDPLYANHLWTARKAPAFLNALLAAPPAIEREPDEPSEVEIIRGAIGALLRWSKDGFKTASEETYAERMAICGACPNLDAPSSRLQHIAARVMAPAPASLHEGASQEKTMCRLCGCVMASKARMQSAVCPDRDPDNPQLSRWGQPFQAPPERRLPPTPAATLESQP